MRRIIVVDDEIGLGEILRDLLEMEGYEVTVCNDVPSAHHELSTSRFDLAMLDVFISDGPVGLDLARHILSEYPGTGIVLMTGYADKADVESACLSGAYTCIAKPFNLDDVLKVVGMVLDGTEIAASAVPG